MAKKQRERVIEVLRCAIDAGGIFGAIQGIYQPGAIHSGWLKGVAWTVQAAASRARQAVHAEGRWMPYDDECLEAAQRLEDGEL